MCLGKSILNILKKANTNMVGFVSYSRINIIQSFKPCQTLNKKKTAKPYD